MSFLATLTNILFQLNFYNNQYSKIDLKPPQYSFQPRSCDAGINLAALLTKVLPNY